MPERRERYPAFFEANAERLRQIERVGRGLGETALWRMSHEQKATEELLDGYIHHVLINHLTRPDNTMRELRRADIYTLRDVLVLGPGRLIRMGVMEGPRNRTITAIRERYPHIYDERFDNPAFEPSPTDIAKICHSLDQVHADVLRGFADESSRLLRANMLQGGRQTEKFRLSVADFLNKDSPMASLIAARLPDDPDEYEPFEAARRDAIEFAEEFLAARQHM